MDRRRLIPLAVGSVLGMSVIASIAAGYQADPGLHQWIFLALAGSLAAGAGAVTAAPLEKKVRRGHSLLGTNETDGIRLGDSAAR